MSSIDESDAVSAQLRQLEQLTREIATVRDIAKDILPTPGEVPRLQGLDIFGGTLPQSGSVGGDLRAATPRFSPESLAHNMKLVEMIKTWAVRKRTTPVQIALAWLMAQKPWIVPIPGTTVMQHMAENAGAADVRFTPAELAELNGAVRAFEVKGQRLPDAVLTFSGVEAPPKK